MTTILTAIQEVTPAWLNDCVGRTFELGNNRVVDITVVKTRKTRISSAYFLQIAYAQPDQTFPTRLFLKLPVPGQSLDREEIEFYNVIVPAMTTAFSPHTSPFVPCFDAAYSSEPERSHLLLADLSLTHFTNEAQMPQSEDLCHALMETYARFHGFWWEHPWLGKQVGRSLTDPDIAGFIQQAQDKIGALCEAVGDDFTAQQLEILRAVSHEWPTRRRARVLAGEGVTIVHRDPHPLNFLYPHEPTVEKVKLIDWQSWRVDTGTDDLAYLMACHWPLDENPGLEGKMLAHYWQALTAAGVRSYSWVDVQYDYRASIIRCLFFLLIAWSPAQWAGGVWRTRVLRGLDAFERWDCGGLLG